MAKYDAYGGARFEEEPFDDSNEIVDGIDTATGHAVDDLGKCLTDPYGKLEFCIGTEDDFHCFDFAKLPDGRIAIHAVVNSETGSFIMDAGYQICRPEDAETVMWIFVDNALEWCRDNGLEEDEVGWPEPRPRMVREMYRLLGKQ